jgi:hypothetical protein
LKSDTAGYFPIQKIKAKFNEKLLVIQMLAIIWMHSNFGIALHLTDSGNLLQTVL